MATMSSLKLTAAVKSKSMSPVQLRRNKMCKGIWEQILLARAHAQGTSYTSTKYKTVVDSETGLRKQVEIPKRVKPWWFTAENGKTAISIRYGSRVIELAKGKYAVEIANPSELVATLELLKSAIDAGELDSQLEITAGTLRSAFQR